MIVSPNEIERQIYRDIEGLNLAQQEAYLKAAERQVYAKSMYHLSHFLGYNKVDRDVHRPVIQTLESKSRRKLITVPRGTFKSTLCSVVYPIFSLIQDPNLRILIDSELMTNSQTFLVEINGHLQSEKMTNLFGPFKNKTNKWNEKQITIAQRTIVRKEASITCSGIGAEKTSQHYDLIICDDLSTPKNTQTPELRQKVIQHFRYYMSLLDPEHGELVVVGTRYHENDIIGWIIENLLDEDTREAIGF